MNKAFPRSLVTFVKFLVWYGVAAALQQAIQQVGNVGIPDVYVPIAAAVLKAAATWVATQTQEASDIQ